MNISIVITVYNKEEHIEKCLDSVFGQTNKNYKVIIVNDGSTDNSEKIIQKKIKNKKNVSYEKIVNGGVSNARNYSIKKVETDYFLFIDADDYIESDLIEKLMSSIEDDTDIIAYGVVRITTSGKIVKKDGKPEFESFSGEEAIKKYILENTYFAMPICYLFRTKFWIENKFEFLVNTFHEDYGLLPLVIAKANRMSSLNYLGYYNVLSENSIMRNNDYSKTVKKAWDCILHFNNLSVEFDKSDTSSDTLDIIYIYLFHTVICKWLELNKNDKWEYVKEIRKSKLYKKLPFNNLKRMIKKIIVFIYPPLYLKIVKGD
jgi:glycosyltransferase involved in cell wall biosynthesis